MASLVRGIRNWVDGIHLNASTRGEREGRAVIVKRRRFGSGAVMAFANGFFRLAQNPVEAITNRSKWRRWEVGCFRRLHGPEYEAGEDARGTAWVELLPGQSLGALLSAGRLQPKMLAAAGAELRRAHEQICEFYGGPWSHGDPHSGNFLYDESHDRARLIDFEVRHLARLPAEERHADDLLVLLQDVCGRCRASDWGSLASALLGGYGRPEIAARLRSRLHVPGGIRRLWWAVRTTWLPRPELQTRLDELAALLPA